MARIFGRTRASAITLVAELTPGQRWTSALVIGGALLLLSFGLPSTGPVARVGTAGAAGAAPAARGPDQPPPLVAAEEPLPALSALPVATPVPPPERPVAAPPAIVPELGGKVSRTPARLVALVRSGDGVLPGRDDAAIAKAFLAQSGFSAIVVPLAADDGATCATAASTATVAMVGVPVDGALRRCLLAHGVVLVGPDAVGDHGPTPERRGQVVSLLRGAGPSLMDLGRWGMTDGPLRGKKVGLVGTSTLRSEIEGIEPVWRALGVRLADVAFLDPGTSGDSQVRAAALGFAAKGVSVVVFAMPVEQQQQWLAIAPLVLPGAAYVVSDVADAIVSETYPPSFDGALAHSSLRVPWYARSHGETPAQTACRTHWEAAATPGTTLSTVELAHAFAWCEDVSLVKAAFAPAASTDAIAAALRRLRLAAALTSDLAPAASGGWGTTQDAVLTWSALCGCWRESKPFAERSPS